MSYSLPKFRFAQDIEIWWHAHACEIDLDARDRVQAALLEMYDGMRGRELAVAKNRKPEARVIADIGRIEALTEVERPAAVLATYDAEIPTDRGDLPGCIAKYGVARVVQSVADMARDRLPEDRWVEYLDHYARTSFDPRDMTGAAPKDLALYVDCQGMAPYDTHRAIAEYLGDASTSWCLERVSAAIAAHGLKCVCIAASELLAEKKLDAEKRIKFLRHQAGKVAERGVK